MPHREICSRKRDWAHLKNERAERETELIRDEGGAGRETWHREELIMDYLGS